ncbi:MAG: endonuclease/exonuclease/phosphatase family protein [Bacteroidales bacterium]|nr:endonuclease/exonuclease/phosphatase family protein [Bacteroidales bacterium]
MKIILKITIVLIFISFYMITPAQDSLKIMTYNIQGMKPGTLPGLRLGNIIEKLKELDPDIIGLQEINESLDGGGLDNQCKQIAEALSDYFGINYSYYMEFTHLSWDNQYREYIGIISKYPVEEEGFFQLVTGVFPRKVVWNYINTPLGKINFFNTHLSFNSQSVRIQQSQQILEYMEDINNQYTAAGTILCGDFNDPPESTTITQITETGSDTTYFDSFREANPEITGYTVPSNAPNSRIDYIFYSNISSFHVDSSKLVMDAPFTGELYCSDHLGVLSVFKEGSAGFYNPEDPDFGLYQNYPNPFSSTTTFSYSLKNKSQVILEVFDITGQRIAELVNEVQQKDKYEIAFNGKDLPPGVYFCVLQTNKGIKIRKLIKL